MQQLDETTPKFEEYVPSLHGMHEVFDMDPSTSRYVPAGQTAQTLEPVLLANDPNGQGLQVEFLDAPASLE